MCRVYSILVVGMRREMTVFQALLTKREVKMAGYWPSSFCVFID